MRRAVAAGAVTLDCSLDLKRSVTCVSLDTDAWRWEGGLYPYPQRCKERTVYYWVDDMFQPVSRYAASLIKLVPTDWGPPTFEIDGIKMLPTASVSPYADAQRKVQLIEPRAKTVLDTCGGLGYFGAWCLAGQAAQVMSFENNADVIWLRSVNPWSPAPDARLLLTRADVSVTVSSLDSGSVDAVLHDPPRFGIAGNLYSQAFYDHLARVLKRRGKLFHYTGSPNKLTSGRDVPQEVATRLKEAGFRVDKTGDGLLATKR